jgi:hypothetical protein
MLETTAPQGSLVVYKNHPVRGAHVGEKLVSNRSGSPNVSVQPLAISSQQDKVNQQVTNQHGDDMCTPDSLALVVFTES